MTPWTVACQALLSMRFSSWEYWNGLPFSAPGYLPNPGIESLFPASSGLQADSLPLSYKEALLIVDLINCCYTSKTQGSSGGGESHAAGLFTSSVWEQASRLLCCQVWGVNVWVHYQILQPDAGQDSCWPLLSTEPWKRPPPHGSWPSASIYPRMAQLTSKCRNVFHEHFCFHLNLIGCKGCRDRGKCFILY